MNIGNDTQNKHLEFFEKGNKKIILGDAMAALQCIQDESIDLIFVDPPYNIGKNFNGYVDKWKTQKEYLEWSYKWIDLCIRKLKKSGSLYVMTSTQSMPFFDIYIRDQMEILSRIIWYYDSSGVQAKKHFGSLYEPILFCVKNKKEYAFNYKDIMVDAKTGSKRKLIDYRKNPPRPYNTQKVPGNVWDFSRVRYRMNEYENHPAQKPVALLERIIKASSNEGDTVLDPFSGTFTTSFVASKLNRKSIGIEINKEYLKIGLRRLDISEKYNGEKLFNERKVFFYKKRKIESNLSAGL